MGVRERGERWGGGGREKQRDRQRENVCMSGCEREGRGQRLRQAHRERDVSI